MSEVVILETGFCYPGSYSSSSVFVVVFSRSNESHDVEELGEELLEGEEFGCINPPGPNQGFGAISNEELEECNAIFPLALLRANHTAEDLADALEMMDGFFVYEGDSDRYSQIMKSQALERIQSSADPLDVLEIVEFELD